jgi:hypothetical protein
MFPTLEELVERFADDPIGRKFTDRLELGSIPEHAPEFGPCLLWTAGKTPKDGYGVFKPSRDKAVMAHRWLYLALNGAVPAGLELNHICHHRDFCAGGRTCPHRPCVLHIRPATKRENLMAGNTAAAILSARTMCEGEHGPHDLTDPKNVYVSPSDGFRHCKPCGLVADRLYRQRRAALKRLERQNGPVQLSLID